MAEDNNATDFMLKKQLRKLEDMSTKDKFWPVTKFSVY